MDQKTFLDDYERFRQEHDKLLEDQYQGIEIERVALSFIEKHRKFIENIPFAYAPTSYPNSSERDMIDEDLSILTMNDSNLGDTRGAERHDSLNVTKMTQIAADVYRRASQGCYLRLTYTQLKLKQHDDRSEAVNWARFAIRYDPNNFDVCYWYMAALGWYLHKMSNPKLRLLMSQAFRHSALHCIRLKPDNYLAHNLLGRYYYEIASLSWFERTVAKSLLGFRLEATFEECEKALLKGYELRKDWLPNGLWMAKVLLAQKRPMKEVADWIEYGLNQHCDEPGGAIEREDLLELKSKLKIGG